MGSVSSCRKYTPFYVCSVNLLIFILIPAVLFAQDISIQDFRIPETKYQRLTGNLSGGWSNTQLDDYGSVNHYSNSDANTNIVMGFLYDFADYNENNSLEINVEMQGLLNHYSNESKNEGRSSLYKRSGSQTGYQLDISPSVSYSNYLVPDEWFWYAEGSVYYSFLQNDYNSTYDYNGTIDQDSTYYKDSRWAALLGGGFGYGKLRDGSSVFAVLRILDKLTEDSVLLRPLTKEEILQIVDIYTRQVEYIYTQEKFLKFFMSDIFVQLQRMGVLKENAMSAYSVMRAVEVLSERIEPRLFGWRARLGFQRTYTEEFRAEDDYSYEGYQTNHTWNFHDYFSLALDYGYPLSLNLQVNAGLTVQVPRIDYERKVKYNFHVAGINQIADRIDAVISGSVSRNSYYYLTGYGQNTKEDNFYRIVSYNAGITFRFYIENNVNFNLGCVYTEERTRQFPLTGDDRSSMKVPAITFGVNYRFL